MKYKVTKPTIGTFPEVLVDQEAVDLIVKAKDQLLELQAIEEKFDFLVENYKDLQKEMFSVLVEDNLYNVDGVGFIYDQSRRINIKLLNFLNSSDMYLKHAAISSKRMSPTKYAELKNKINRTENENTSFKLLNTLRDHFQHFGFPTFAATGGSWVGTEDERVLTHYVHVDILLRDFLADSQVRKRFRASDFENAEKLELNMAIKDYFQAVADLTVYIRDLFEAEYSSSKSVIEAQILEYEKVFPSLATDWQKILGIWDDESRKFLLTFNKNAIDLIGRLRISNSNYQNLRNRALTDLTSKNIESIRSARP